MSLRMRVGLADVLVMAEMAASVGVSLGGDLEHLQTIDTKILPAMLLIVDFPTASDAVVATSKKAIKDFEDETGTRVLLKGVAKRRLEIIKEKGWI